MERVWSSDLSLMSLVLPLLRPTDMAPASGGLQLAQP